MATVELWGGVECTVNRVGDEFFDQLEMSGHRARLSDLELFAELGIRKLRYPVLWESVAPDGLNTPNWQWADERLPRLRDLGIDPIVGLVHHGSGPRYTALHADNFVAGLARYARMVAERYPWVNHYTPVNEPLTTARFSGLYGLWYPHSTDDRLFVRMLLNEVLGTRAAMLAIREVNPKAKLVQTEDLGKVHSTGQMAYQAEFENHRRWLTFDLLCGRVDAHHYMWRFLRDNGAPEAELLDLVANPLPPDILGINYYVTSERFLDDERHHYPERCYSRNHHDEYADIEAVRVLPLQMAGIKQLLREAWERYQLPIAITESHLGCTREEQLRWLLQSWNEANALRQEGANIRAVTVWSLLGAFDWDSLLTRRGGSYESGVFDVRSGQPRPTALFKMVQSLARSGRYQHPLLANEGWWRRPDRFVYRTSPIV
ncbi:family 1 glycosylhydrolase [Hymenobacter oligotrophus]|uniref:family 1 glycosylhydrolase n=1 Tax=Hymenobacter oligotrophus TaxID=2319843 RepID=UPI0019699E0F|nr:family 1 glycosylhydrolase [Hymenobacter oligotrophus]